MDQSNGPISPEEDAAAAAERQRAAPRDSMLLQAGVRRRTATGEPAAEVATMRVRNLSPGGMMAETHEAYARGEVVTIELRNVGTVPGRVAWTAVGRIGIAFDHPIDPQEVRRAPPQSPGTTMLLMKPPVIQTRRPGLKIG